MIADATYVSPMGALEVFYDEPGELDWILEGFKQCVGFAWPNDQRITGAASCTVAMKGVY